MVMMDGGEYRKPQTLDYTFDLSKLGFKNEANAETFNAESGEPIYVVRRDYTGGEIWYVIGTEEYIRRELAEPIDITADEGDIDYEGMSLEEIFDTVFEYSDEYGPDLVGKFTDGMYLRLKSYDGDKDVGVLEMFDGETLDYTFDLEPTWFSNMNQMLKSLGAEYRQYEVVSFDEINKYRDTLSMHDTLEGAKTEAQKQSETIHSPIYVYEYRIDDDDYETVAKWMKHEGKLVHYINKYEAESFGAEGYIDDGLIWEMRDRLEPPAQGYVMFASSSPEVNIPYLLDKGYDRDEIIIVEYGGNETIWIPNTPPLKRAEEFGADGR